jgi:hypothetical protein
MVELARAWLYAIPVHPGAYLRHRLVVFREMAALGTPRVCRPIQDGIVANTIGLEFRGSSAYTFARDTAVQMANATPMFRAWVYMAGTLAFLVFAVGFRSGLSDPAVVLGTSALLYAAAFLPAATTCDFRMSWWVVVATILLPLSVSRRPL